MATFRELWRKLTGSKDYRKEFVSTLLKRGTAMQIQSLMKKKGWTQAQLAEHAGLTQGVISRASNPDYGNLTFNTVIDIAAGFDVAFIGRFVPFSEFAKWVKNMPEKMDFSILSFEDENKNQPGILERLESEQALQAIPDYKDSNLVAMPAEETENKLESQLPPKKQPQPEQAGSMPRETNEQKQMAGVGND